MCHPRRFVIITFAVFMLTAFCFQLSAVRAQSATATLSGTVEDEKGAVVPGVTVAVLNVDTSYRRETTTNESGSFLFTLLPIGNYSLTAERDGFKVLQVPNIVLNVGNQKALNIQLQTGNISEAVTITGEAPLIDESPAVATTVDRVFVQNIPLNGRTFQNLILLAPGVSQAGGTFGGFNVNGQRSESNYFTVDGVSANAGTSPFSLVQNQTGGAQAPLTASGGTQSLLSVDEMQEFTLQTSTYGAKFGREPGGQVSIVTRSGTNQYSGTLFEYVRNEAFDANNWFANRSGLKRPATRQNDFGGVFGGPLLLPRFGEGGPAFSSGKDRTFFFFSYEGLRLKVPHTATFNVPSVSYRQAAFPALQPVLNAYPTPNGLAVDAGTAQYIAAYSDSQHADAYSVRIDHSFSKTMNIFGRYHDAPSYAETRQTTILNSQNYLRTRTLTIGSTWVVNPKVTNDLRFNWSRSTGRNDAFFDGFGGAAPFDETTLLPSFADKSSSALFVRLLGSGTSVSSLQIGKTGNNIQRQINLVDDLTIVEGKHTFQIGVDYRRINPTQRPLPYRLNYTITNSVTGQTTVGAQALDASTLLFHNLSLYGDDTWKVTPRLTLTLGLRWEFVPPPHATAGAQPLTLDSFNDLSKATLASPGTPIWKTRYNDFAPRFGAAYIARNKAGREMVLRGGFGIFYDLGMSGMSDVITSIPYNRSATIGVFTFPGPIEQFRPPLINFTGPYSSISVNSRDLKLPLTYQWNFSVEQSLGTEQTITASYVGSAGRRLIRLDSYFSGGNPALILNPALISAGGSLSVYENGSTSDYKALQIQYQRRLSRGLQALVNYTLSKSEDTASSDTENTIPGADESFSHGRSSFDRTHIFSAAATYNIPTPFSNRSARMLLGGWSLSPIVSIESAPPVDVVIGSVTPLVLGLSRTGIIRPDLVPGVPIYLTDPTAPGGRRLNPVAFAAVSPSTGRIGNLERNTIRGFGFWQADVSLSRQFKLGEKKSIELRAESFNVFNHSNFNQPSRQLGSISSTGVFTRSASFGRATSTLNNSLSGGLILNSIHVIGGPRSMQFALRFNF